MNQTSSNNPTYFPTENELIKLFIDTYTLPKYADYLQNTQINSVERSDRVSSLISQVKRLYKRVHEKLPQNLNQLNSIKYFEKQTFLKSKVLDYIQYLYPNLSTFTLVQNIFNKLGRRYENQCQQLMNDINQRRKQNRMKREVQSIIERRFRKFDQDNSGYIDMKQLQHKMQMYGLPKIIAKGIMDKADLKKNNLISLQEFKIYAEGQIMKYFLLFYHLDSDNDQRLNKSQARQSLIQIFPKIQINSIFDRLFQTMDQQKSGLITFQQWCDFLIIFPQRNLNKIINQWQAYTSTMISPQQSSSFLTKDLMKRKKKDTVISIQDYIRILTFGGISGAISRTVTAPLQNIKVHFQTMYTETKCPTIMTGLKQIYQRHGFVGLFKGNSISIALNCVQQGIRCAIMEYEKKNYQVYDQKINPTRLFYIGVVTGVMSSLILFPLEVLRIRFISNDYMQNISAQARKIYDNSGFRGFYSGITPYLISVLPTGTFNVVTYNILRKIFYTEKDLEHPRMYKFMAIGGLSGLITNTFIYPLSLLTSRLIVINKDIKQFKNKTKTYQLMKNIYQHEGFFGFYKGFSASILRVFIGQSFNTGTYETLKALWFKKQYFI